MSTTLAKLETVERKWYVLDAAGKPLGRTAVIAANLLRGKHKVDFTPNVDCGDFVIVRYLRPTGRFRRRRFWSFSFLAQTATPVASWC